MKDTEALRSKMLKLWETFDQGKLTATEARVHIGMARTILDTLKVEIAAAHLNSAILPAVGLLNNTKSVQGRRVS